MTFSLRLEDGDGITATFENGKVTVRLPRSRAQAWISSKQVGLEEYLPLEGGERLHLLIEKDFPCKHMDSEDLTDTFAELVPQDNPQT